jgi:16S rRNA (guanine(966)-N(2))-methyltransferase RsmD
MAKPRIISGSAKGVILDSVPGNITRPITDRVKEALFNIISADIKGATFLDLFAGTGSVGLEALSRGAKFAKLIELNLKAIKVLRTNLNKCKFDKEAEIYAGDAFSYIKTERKDKFDYIFIAPPQYHELWSKMLILIDNNIHFLNQYAWLIVQIDPNEIQKIDLSNLSLFDQRKYGSTLLLFYIFNSEK